jgi:cyclic-di-GMP phosphodiesterase TipF (flagellum assembly factor)
MPLIAHIMLAAVYLTAAVVGAVALHRFLAFDPEVAGLIGGCCALAALQIHGMVARAASDGATEKRLFEVRNDLRKLAGRVTQAETRADEMKAAFETELTARRETLVTEMRGLEKLISNLSQNFESRLQLVRQQGAGSSADASGALEAVRDALRANRVDLHLQPIVNLPQRRVCFYEGFTRLRRTDGKLIMPNEFMVAAEQANLLGVIDNMLLFRCVQIVRRLSERDRRVGVFCNVSKSSFEDDTFFPAFLDFMRENRDLAGSMIFELGVRAFRQRSDAVSRNMGRLRELGFRFSLDKGDGLAFDLPELQAAGVRFVKVNGERLLQELVPGGERPTTAIVREVPPKGVPALFNRYGVDLIAEKVENEKSVVEILEFEVPYGQGHVFGAPRPIRGSLLEETSPPPEFIRRVGASAMSS